MNREHHQKITISELIGKFKDSIAYLKSKSLLILSLTLLGAFSGIALSLIFKPKYTAVYTFAVEDNSQDGLLGQYAGLASLAGFGVNSGSSIFKGDNIIELYKSRTMIKRALLTYADFNGRQQLLIDRYAGFNHLNEKWMNDNNLKTFTFSSDPDKASRIQDSIISDVANLFNKNGLEVAKPDKKLSLIRIAFTSTDEQFALKFTKALVDNVNGFYIQTKTKKATFNVTTLQHQADSIRAVLNRSIYGVASSLDEAPNANPAMTALRVPSQRKQVDVQANTAIYSELVKNLELSKMSLRQQTPLIQFIDQPVLPLEKSRLSKLKGAVAGAVLFFFATGMFLIIKGWLNSFQL